MLVIRVGGDGDGAAELAVDLHGHLAGGVMCLGLVVLRPGHLHGHLAGLCGVAGQLPHLLHHVRREGAEHEQKLLKVALGQAVGVELVDHGHERGDSGIHLEAVDILSDLLDGLVDDGLVLGGDFLVVGRDIHEVPAAVKEALGAFDGVVRPRNCLLEVADEHDVQAHSVRADVVRVDDVAAGFGHLLAALAEDHAVAGALGIRLLGGHDADVVQELMPEAAV